MSYFLPLDGSRQHIVLTGSLNSRTVDTSHFSSAYDVLQVLK